MENPLNSPSTSHTFQYQHQHPQCESTFVDTGRLQRGVIINEGEIDTIRKVTDIRWLWIFIGFAIICVVGSLWATVTGDPKRLTRGMNYQGKVCGSDASVEHLRYLYVPVDPRRPEGRNTGSGGGGYVMETEESTSDAKSNIGASLMLHDGRCVEHCFSAEDEAAGISVAVPVWEVVHEPDRSSAMAVEYRLASPVYASEALANALCIPKNMALQRELTTIFATPMAQMRRAVGAFAAAWPIVLSCLFLASVTAFVFSIMIRIHASILLAVATIVLLVVTPITALFLFYHGLTTVFHPIIGHFFYIDAASSVIVGLLLLCFFCFSFFVFFLCRRTIMTAVKILECAGSTIFDMPNIFMAPVIFSIISILWVLIWCRVFMYISSCGFTENIFYSIGLQSNGDIGIVPLHRHILWDTRATVLGLLWWIALFWVFEFFTAFCHFILAYASTVWYFSPPEGGEDRDVGWCSPLLAINAGLLCHSGSFALGGLIMGVTRPIRIFFPWASTHRFFFAQHSSKILYFRQFFNSIIGPISFIVDRFTSSGYIEMSVSSRPFFSAMERSLNRILNSRSPASQLHGVCSMTTTIACMAISITTGLLCFMTLTGFEMYNSVTSDNFVCSPLLISLLTTVATAFISSYYISIWDIVADTLMYCFLVESAQPPIIDENPLTKVHAPPALRELLIEAYEEVQMQPYAFQ